MNHDLISRDAVLDACSQSINMLDAMSRIEDLPSVTPIPCEDVISRQAAISDIQEMAEWHTEDAFNADRVIQHLKDLPSVTPKQRWIPVSERLPEDHDWYVIVVKEKSTGYQYIPRIASHNHDNCWSIIDTEDADKDWLDDLECVAWMPLPEPYKVEPQESEEGES